MKNINEFINEESLRIPAINLTRASKDPKTFVYNTLIYLYNALKNNPDYAGQVFDILNAEDTRAGVEQFLTVIEQMKQEK
jgi:hypothetical protein